MDNGYPAGRGQRGRKLPVARAALLLVGNLLCGCAALTNPVAVGLPARDVPPELLGESREGKHTVPLSLLRRPPSRFYRLAAGDVIGLWFEGIPLLSAGSPAPGQPAPVPPVNVSGRTLPPERIEPAPSLGLPFVVQEDGTVLLPLLAAPVSVRGLTLAEARARLLDAYVAAQIIKRGTEKFVVTLVRQRATHVLVLRHDTSLNNLNTNLNNNFIVTNVGTLNGESEVVSHSPTGTGYLVDLPGDENDVLTALALSGGFPGTNAIDEVIVYRGLFRGDADRALMMHQLEALGSDCNAVFPGAPGGPVVRIPIRVHPGEEAVIRPEDVVLQNGDVVFVEAPAVRTFYTGGLLPPGEHVLPRDYDLPVLQAILRTRGPVDNGAFSQSNLSGNIIARGIGDPSPSLLSVLRRCPDGGQLTIRVDLNRAMCDPRENILVQPGDVLVLQETPTEAVVRFFTEQFNFVAFWQVIPGRRTNATVTAMAQ
jgi:protein involved in polysaccharide export with SLBB domain